MIVHEIFNAITIMRKERIALLLVEQNHPPRRGHQHVVLRDGEG
jgi:ABC-type branched-subunit amino acid transport system ATPase component